MEQAQHIEAVVMGLFDDGIYPSRRKVSEIIRGGGISLAKKCHLAAYRRLIKNSCAKD